MTDSRYFISIIVYWCAFTLYISVIPAVIVSISAGVTKLEGYGNSQLYVHTYFMIILFLVISWGHCILIIKRGLNRFLFLNLFVLTKTEENIIIISFTFESHTKRQIKKKGICFIYFNCSVDHEHYCKRKFFILSQFSKKSAFNRCLPEYSLVKSLSVWSDINHKTRNQTFGNSTAWVKPMIKRVFTHVHW